MTRKKATAKTTQPADFQTADLLPPLPKLVCQAMTATGALPQAARHVLMLLPADAAWHDAPGVDALLSTLKRQGKAAEALAKGPVRTEDSAGVRVWVRLDAGKPAFERQARLLKALQPLLEEHPDQLDIAVFGPFEFRAAAAREAVQVGWLNTARLPTWKTEPAPRALERIAVHGVDAIADLPALRALVEGNLLCRCLTLLPPNQLEPGRYRQHIRTLAKAEGWAIDEYDTRRLHKLGAGAFLAVARGSHHDDAVIVRLSYAPKAGKRAAKGEKGQKEVRPGHVAVVGKGICFDTGGHNLKPARYMHNMHDDMNGSAVALGILLAASRQRLPVRLEVWLAIAHNHLSPEAYTQNEVVTALNGTTIEIIHTDAEGRMVLADTLALAAQAKPDLILDFATLTGSMAVALGDRMSGVISNQADWAQRALQAGAAAGERVVVFPMPEDYDAALDSTVADVKQCTLDGEADHILAARFLQRFVDGRPWLHVDLSACRCKGGLGGVASDITGFGVGLGLGLLSAVART